MITCYRVYLLEIMFPASFWFGFGYTYAGDLASKFTPMIIEAAFCNFG